jgi:hypothetical protein
MRGHAHDPWLCMILGFKYLGFMTNSVYKNLSKYFLGKMMEFDQIF